MGGVSRVRPVVLFEPGGLVIPFPLFLWAGGPAVVFCMTLLLSSVKGSAPALCGLDLPSQSSSSSETQPSLNRQTGVCVFQVWPLDRVLIC